MFESFLIAVPIIRLIHHDVPSPNDLGEKLVSLDQKVSDIDEKLVSLKNQLDNNFLPNDDIKAEASEKKPISMNVVEITKAMSNEVMNHVTIEIENLRQQTTNMDRKLQFHMNLVSDTLGAVYTLAKDIHEAVIDKNSASLAANTTTLKTQASSKSSKIDKLMDTINPMNAVAEKMNQVWNVVVS